MTPEVAEFLREFGLPIFILFAAAIFGARGTWVWGRELRAADARAAKAEARADAWQAIALKALNVGEKAVDSATKAVPDA